SSSTTCSPAAAAAPGLRAGEQVVDDEAELIGDGVERADGRHHASPFDLRDETRRDADVTREPAHRHVLAFAILTKLGYDVGNSSAAGRGVVVRAFRFAPFGHWAAIIQKGS